MFGVLVERRVLELGPLAEAAHLLLHRRICIVVDWHPMLLLSRVLLLHQLLLVVKLVDASSASFKVLVSNDDLVLLVLTF